MRNKVICTDYDSMGDFSRFPKDLKNIRNTKGFFGITKIYSYLYLKFKNKDMKKILLLVVVGILVGSCSLFKDPSFLTYTLIDGECYPTDKNIKKMIVLEKQTGVEYAWFECEWVSREVVDSIKTARQ